LIIASTGLMVTQAYPVYLYGVAVSYEGTFYLKQLAADPAGINGAMYYNTTSNKIRVYVNGAWSDIGGVDTFLDLTDTPASYASSASKIVKVNPGETALEFMSNVTSASGLLIAEQVDGAPAITGATRSWVTKRTLTFDATITAGALLAAILTINGAGSSWIANQLSVRFTDGSWYSPIFKPGYSANAYEAASTILYFYPYSTAGKSISLQVKLNSTNNSFSIYHQVCGTSFAVHTHTI